MYVSSFCVVNQLFFFMLRLYVDSLNRIINYIGPDHLNIVQYIYIYIGMEYIMI